MLLLNNTATLEVPACVVEHLGGHGYQCIVPVQVELPGVLVRMIHAERRAAAYFLAKQGPFDRFASYDFLPALDVAAHFGLRLHHVYASPGFTFGAERLSAFEGCTLWRLDHVRSTRNWCGSSCLACCLQ